MSSRKIPLLIFLALFALLALAAGCSSAQKKDDEAAKNQANETRNQLSALSQRVDSLETKLSAMNDRFETTRATVDNLTGSHKPKPTAVVSHPAETAGAPVQSLPAKNDPEAGFSSDSAVQGYRRALVFFQAKKFSESVLAFSSFLERYADHPLAGAAQFYVGESYLQQKEYKLALQEFQRVLTSYDRSSHVALALRRMAEAEDALGNKDAAAKHRQSLTSLFPQSPAASNALANAPGTRIKSEAPAKAEAPAKSEAPAKAAAPEKATTDEGAHQELPTKETANPPKETALDGPPPTAPSP